MCFVQQILFHKYNVDNYIFWSYIRVLLRLYFASFVFCLVCLLPRWRSLSCFVYGLFCMNHVQVGTLV